MSDTLSRGELNGHHAALKASQADQRVMARAEACARDMIQANQAFKTKLDECSPEDGMRETVKWAGQIDEMLRQCLEDLRVVDAALATAVTQRIALEQQLSRSEALRDRHLHMALHDDLTGLPNRVLFRDRLHKALDQSRRHERPFATMLIDIDDFKSINDKQGHVAGDRVLSLVASHLLASVREEDTVARVGGDEFQCLLMEAKDEAAIAKIAASMIARTRDAAGLDGITTELKLSIGIAFCPRDGTDPDLLYKHADAAMYTAKAAGTGYGFWRGDSSNGVCGLIEAPHSNGITDDGTSRDGTNINHSA
jgi:diguanylate cyclase (GGDEF)-like protein